MVWTKKKIESILVFVLVIAGFAFLVVWRENISDVDARYSIAHVYDTRLWVHKAEYKIDYYYYFRGEKLLGNATYKDCKVPCRYYTKFPSAHPNLDEIFQDHPVPDSIKQAPSEGWLSPPWEEWVETQARITRIVSEDFLEVCYKESSVEFCTNIRQSGFEESSVGKWFNLRYCKGQFSETAKLHH